MLRHLTLKSKLLLSFFLVTSVSIAATTLFSIQYFSKKINDEAKAHMRKNIRVAELIYENKVTEILNFAQNLSHDIVLQKFIYFNLKTKIPDYLATQEIIQREQFTVIVFDYEWKRVAYVDPNSFVGNVCSVEDLSQSLILNNLRLRVSDETPALIGKSNPLASAEIISTMSADEELLSITAVSSIFKDNERIGAILVRFVLNGNTELIDEIDKLLGVTATIYRRGIPLNFKGTPSEQEGIYNTFTREWSNEKEILDVEKHDIRLDGQLAVYKPINDMNGKPLGIIGISLSANHIVRTQRQAVFTLLGIMVACITGAYGFAYFLARSILIPIQNLLQGVVKISSGDLSYELAVQSQNELGKLALAFNGMARQLKDLFDTLEQRVKNATQELQATLAYMAAIIDDMADGLLATDPDGRVTRTNPALAEMLGLDDSNIIGLNAQEVFDEDVTALVEKTSDGTQKHQTAEIRMANGRVGKAVAAAIYRGSAQAEKIQECIGSVVLTRDITKEKEIDQMKTDFISTVSHELRTPLTSVIGFTKIIKKRFEKVLFPQLEHIAEKKTVRAVKQVRENLDIIIVEGERLTGLINDVLDIAKMEAGKIDWRMEQLSVTEIIERATVATSSLFAKKEKGLAQIKAVEENLSTIVGDRDRLIQVVINLISNAVKFTDEGSVTCQARLVNNELVISVIDTGDGIAEVDQPKVFEKFKQVGDTLTDKPQGTGLGLPICKQIVEHHGGKIWVASKPGAGSTFSFSLPVLKEGGGEERSMNRDTFLQRVQERAAHVVPVDSESKKTLLVVDDDAQIRKLLRHELKSEGYLVKEAENGKDAITQVKKECPDLILLDILMPGMNGFETAALLKSNPGSMDIPVIILSATTEEEVGHHFGVDAYLTKPFDTRILLQKIAELLSQEASQKKIFVVGEDPKDVDMLGSLLSEGHDVFKICDMHELKTQALKELPEMIIASTTFAEEQNIIATLRSEKKLEHLFFLLLGEENR